MIINIVICNHHCHCHHSHYPYHLAVIIIISPKLNDDSQLTDYVIAYVRVIADVGVGRQGNICYGDATVFLEDVHLVGRGDNGAVKARRIVVNVHYDDGQSTAVIVARTAQVVGSDVQLLVRYEGLSKVIKGIQR